MAKNELPIYSLQKFNTESESADFYVNTLKKHLTDHHFIDVPHKHDFFMTVLFTHGNGTHEIDFTTYKVKPGSVFMLSPGQTHNWKLSNDVEGYIFFHTKDFYNLAFTNETILQFPFFSSIYNTPFILLKQQTLNKIMLLFKEILKEHFYPAIFTKQKIVSLITLVYIELSVQYKFLNTQITQNSNYLLKLRKLEALIDEHFKDLKSPKEYASLMNITEKHLNRICKLTINKTSTQLITDRIIIESKRLMAQSSQSITQISESLGYSDNSYFSRLFKKHTGETPLNFQAKYRH